MTRVTTEPIGVGVGLVGQLFRAADGGRRRAVDGHRQARGADRRGRFVATVLNMYGREVGFYSELSPRTTIAHPECFYADHDPGTQDSVLLLEDVSVRGRGGDQVAGLLARRGAARDPDAARLHACFWDDPVAHDVAVPVAARRRPVPGRGGDGVRDRRGRACRSCSPT